jgi:hypothetical protein
MTPVRRSVAAIADRQERSMFRFKSRRKRTYVNARVQGRIVGRVAAYWVLYHIVLWHGLFVFRYAQVRMSSDEMLLSQPVNSIYWQFCINHVPLLMAALLIMPLFMLDFVRLTHRVVGPLVRAGDALQKLMRGERVPAVEFRKGDLLTEFENTFNDFLAYYEAQRSAKSAARANEASGRDDRMTESQAEIVESTLMESPTAVRV